MTNKVVVVLLGTGANDSIRALLVDYADTLVERGLATVLVDLMEPAELNAAVEIMKGGEALFAMTWLGIGQDLGMRTERSTTVSVFEALNVPLVKVHGDLPAYFADMHRDMPCNAGNMYQAEEFVTFRRRFLPECICPAVLVPPIPMIPREFDKVDFGRREAGPLVFLKNGNSPESLRQMWKERLSPIIARWLCELAEEVVAYGLRSGRLDIGGLASDFLRAQGLHDPVPNDLVIFLSAQMDDYLRRVKSTIIAKALLDFPVIVQGSNWEHIDFTGRRAELVAGENATVSQERLSSWFGVIDMAPNVDMWPHDRVQRAAGAYSLVLTSRQSWLTERFADFDDLAYEFEEDAIRARVADALAHRKKYIDLAVAFATRFRQLHARKDFADAAIRCAEAARLLGPARPRVQDFYIWPSRHRR